MAGRIGVSVQVLQVSKGHAAINKDLGLPGRYTEAVAGFIPGVM